MKMSDVSIIPVILCKENNAAERVKALTIRQLPRAQSQSVPEWASKIRSRRLSKRPNVDQLCRSRSVDLFALDSTHRAEVRANLVWNWRDGTVLQGQSNCERGRPAKIRRAVEAVRSD